MYHEKIYLDDIFPNLPKVEHKPNITLYIPEVSEAINENAAYSCVVICPGGGYSYISKREGEPVALRLVGNGIAAAVVDYSCGGSAIPGAA